MADRVTFTRPAAERIGKVVRIVEAGDREAAPYAVDVRLQNQGGGAIKICTFTGAWPIGGSKTVDAKFPPNTSDVRSYTAVNLFASVSGACGARDCAIAKDGGTWYLISVQCD